MTGKDLLEAWAAEDDLSEELLGSIRSSAHVYSEIERLGVHISGTAPGRLTQQEHDMAMYNRVRKMRRLIGELPATWQLVIVLKFKGRASGRDIAKIMKWNKSVVPTVLRNIYVEVERRYWHRRTA